MERAVVMSETDLIRLADLPLALQTGQIAEEFLSPEEARDSIRLGLGRTMREVEKEYTLRTLREMGGNRTRTAQVLGISVRGLRDKLKEWGYSTGQG
jgi:DNA-binding NtrC family response regulator